MGQTMRAEVIGRFEVTLSLVLWETISYGPKEERWYVSVSTLHRNRERVRLLRTNATPDYDLALQMFADHCRERAIITAEEVLDLKPINLRSPRV